MQVMEEDKERLETASLGPRSMMCTQEDKERPRREESSSLPDAALQERWAP